MYWQPFCKHDTEGWPWIGLGGSRCPGNGASVGFAQMLFGAVLSCVVALLFTVALHERRIGILATAGGAALVMPMLWNSILNCTGATGLFSHHLPFPPFPVSWQDTGSGVFTLAGSCLGLMVGAAHNGRPRRIAAFALATAAAALVVDVYFYKERIRPTGLGRVR